MQITTSLRMMVKKVEVATHETMANAELRRPSLVRLCWNLLYQIHPHCYSSDHDETGDNHHISYHLSHINSSFTVLKRCNGSKPASSLSGLYEFSILFVGEAVGLLLCEPEQLGCLAQRHGNTVCIKCIKCTQCTHRNQNYSLHQRKQHHLGHN